MKPGKLLARMRADMLREQDRGKLVQLDAALKAARARRSKAMQGAVLTCRRARKSTAERIVEFRKAERERVAAEVKTMRTAARNRCQARKHFIRKAGGRVVDQRRQTLRAERALQAQMQRLAQHARMRTSKHATTSKERKAESDDYVRGNLPPELVGVFNAVRGQIKGGPRTTRTEAFLQWAEENPGDVLHHQAHDTDREVAALVAEHEGVSARMRKGKRGYQQWAAAMGDVVPF